MIRWILDFLIKHKMLIQLFLAIESASLIAGYFGSSMGIVYFQTGLLYGVFIDWYFY